MQILIISSPHSTRRSFLFISAWTALPELVGAEDVWRSVELGSALWVSPKEEEEEEGLVLPT
jgi:hypothetical protein